MGWLPKLKWSPRMVLKTLKELCQDLWNYYFTPYPILLVIGAFRRLLSRLKLIWVPRGRGRPTISPEVVELVLEMKRDNPGWGALRISQELALLGVIVSDEAVRRLFHASQGKPRRINQLALQTLIQAAIQGRDNIDGKFVTAQVAAHRHRR